MPPVKCPHCGNRHHARTRHLGRTVICPACQGSHTASTGRGRLGNLLWRHHPAGLALGLALALVALVLLGAGLSSSPLLRSGRTATVPPILAWLSFPFAAAAAWLVRRWAGSRRLA